IEPYPLYYGGDEEVYLKAGKMTDGSFLVAAINLISDPIEHIQFETTKKIIHVYRLEANGAWKSVRFNQTTHHIQLFDTAEFMLPIVWRLN
ncbi:MAG: hypothetical protein PHU66_07745, partial [Bacteroidaceae bacterium]|nr:hypothetical protein [Bacteroidaceae bacterium]